MKKTTFHRVLTLSLLILNLLAVGGLICAYLAPYVDPRDNFIFALFGLLYPWLLLANMLFGIIWLIMWKRYAWISLIAILAGWNQLHAMAAWNSGERILTPGNNISLISYNVHGFLGPQDETRQIRSEVTEYLAEEHPDLLMLQEFKVREKETGPVLRAMSKKWELPYRAVTNYFQAAEGNGIIGIATFSRFPIIIKHNLEHAPGKRFAQICDLVIDQDTFRIMNVHLASLHLGQNDVEFYYQLRNNDADHIDLKKGVFSILRKLKAAFELRSVQVSLLTGEIMKSPYPVILAGDLNDTPFSFTYRKLTQLLTDSFREAGRDFPGNTYDGALPNYRIDYIMHDRHSKAFSYERKQVGFSDHYPVYVLLTLDY